MRQCPKCATGMPDDGFHLSARGRKDGRASWCKACANKATTTWAKANRAAASKTALQWSRIHKYGATPEWIEEYLDAQEGMCAACDLPLTEKFSVDHDHVTGMLRGLLHGTCNVGLGNFQDSPIAIENATSYLQQFATA